MIEVARTKVKIVMMVGPRRFERSQFLIEYRNFEGTPYPDLLGSFAVELS